MSGVVPLQSNLLANLTADYVLSPYVYAFYASFLVAFAFTPIMRNVAIHFGIVDRPDHRKMHSTPVPYLGGVAVFLGWLVAIAISSFITLHGSELGPPFHHVQVPISIVIGGMIIVAVGLYDDAKGISPWVKVGGQALAAVVLLVQGVGRGTTRQLLAPIDHRLDVWFHVHMPPWVVFVTSCALTIAIVVYCCNATNLMDGLDGLCGGVTAIIAAGFLFLAVSLGKQTDVADNWWVAPLIVLALSLLGAVLGFIPYNFNPASIFMGDTGSMFLGFACAIQIVKMGEVDARWLLASMVIFALPILDTSLAFARRWVNGRPIFSPDKLHLHHQLVARGLSVKQTVILSYGLAVGFAVLGSAIVFMKTRYAVAIYLVIFGSIIEAAFKMGMIHETTAAVAKGRNFDVQPVTNIEPSSVLEVRLDDRIETPAALKETAPPGTWQSPSPGKA